MLPLNNEPEIDWAAMAEVKEEISKRHQEIRLGNNKAHRSKNARTQQRKAAKASKKRNRQ